MPPVRRYLRVSRYTVLEVRIHLKNPADEHRWLLHPNEPALSRVIQAVRPMVVPKLREENERVRKGAKKKPVRDVVVREDFEVSVFFTSLLTPHSVLKRHKTFVTKQPEAEAGRTKDAPMEIGEEEEPPQVPREQSDEGDVVKMEDIPVFDDTANRLGASADSPAAVSDASGEAGDPESHMASDDKKKMGLSATYEGFRIYGHILTLVVTRKSGKEKEDDGGAGNSTMEAWIASTQSAEPVMADD